MTPEQFLSHLKRGEPEPVYLFLGPEPYRRTLCRRALTDKAIGTDDREQGLAVHDLQSTPLAAVLDDACSLSLFAPRRLIWISNAEAALPRGKAAGGAEHEELPGQALLARYLERPSPGVVLVLDAARYEFEGEDKAKLERVQHFYGSIKAVVEFSRYAIGEARHLAQELSAKAGLAMDHDAVEWMVDALGADAMRIANEIEKLRLYAGGRGKIGLDDLASLVPDSSVSTVFALVDALGRRDRLRALELMDTLTRQGEYMPLALSFLGSLFRQALVAKEQGLRSSQQIQQALSRPGRPVWRSRAEQIQQTASVFSKEQLEQAMGFLYHADWSLRDARPSDRVVMERLILELGS